MAQNKPRFGLFAKIVLYFMVVGVLTWLAGVLLRCSSGGPTDAARAPTPCVLVFTRPTAVAGYQAVPSAEAPCPTQAPGQEAAPCPTQAPGQTAAPCPTQPAPEVVVQECPACPTQEPRQDPAGPAPQAGQRAGQAAPPCECPDAQQDASAPAPVGAHIELRVRPAGGPCGQQPESVWTVVQWQDAVGAWHDVAGWRGWLDEGWRKAWWVDEKDLGTGPFRWAVVCNCRCQLWAVSTAFNLPAQPGQYLRVEVLLGG